jgi:hypothetical protein
MADPHPRGIQRIVSKRMKGMELRAFVRGQCLLAVEKDGTIWECVARMAKKQKRRQDAGATGTGHNDIWGPLYTGSNS